MSSIEIAVSGNVLNPLPDASAAERFDDLLVLPGCRVERIVSRGQCSPPGFWYRQEWDEWVLLLAGSAVLTLDGRSSPLTLASGDYLLIPAGVRHRVESTGLAGPTIWLAVHVATGPGGKVRGPAQ